MADDFKISPRVVRSTFGAVKDQNGIQARGRPRNSELVRARLRRSRDRATDGGSVKQPPDLQRARPSDPSARIPHHPHTKRFGHYQGARRPTLRRYARAAWAVSRGGRQSDQQTPDHDNVREQELSRMRGSVPLQDHRRCRGITPRAVQLRHYELRSRRGPTSIEGPLARFRLRMNEADARRRRSNR